MNAVLVCPSESPGISFLTPVLPLASGPLLGDSLLGFWLHYAARQRWQNLRIVVTDRPERIRETVGDGWRWGLGVEVVAELRELSLEEIRLKHAPSTAADFPVLLLDRLPGQPVPMIDHYAAWYRGALEWMPQVHTTGRVGLREVSPGVWVNLRAQVARNVKLIAPCWLGENVAVGPDSVIGPNSILEDRVVVESASIISNSIIGPDTFVGTLTNVNDSIAMGSSLINWRTGSHTVVPDEFLLCPLAESDRSIYTKKKSRRRWGGLWSGLMKPFELLTRSSNCRGGR